jgi:membrane protein YqaA with SNARE-associated domain
MFRRLYNWVLGLAAGPYALPALACAAFIEATFPMIPPDALLMPMVLARRDKAFVYAGVCTLASVLGGCVGYLIGHFLGGVAHEIAAITHRTAMLDSTSAWFRSQGVWVILIKGLTPIPFVLVTLASGIAGLSFPAFVAAATITRGGRFFLETAVLQHPKAKTFIDEHVTVLAIAGVAVLIVAWLLVDHFSHR